MPGMMKIAVNKQKWLQMAVSRWTFLVTSGDGWTKLHMNVNGCIWL